MLLVRFLKRKGLLKPEMKKNEIALYKMKALLSKAFADPMRLMIIDELRKGEKTVSELVEAVEAPQAAVSRNLAILRDRGIVMSRRNGLNVIYSLTDPRICEACDIVHAVLMQQMENGKKMAKILTG
jgi:ArsR family transcriptional regulator, virulence genes transcriptional regulator